MSTKGITKGIPRNKRKPKKDEIRLVELVQRTGHARDTLLHMVKDGTLKAAKLGPGQGTICITWASVRAARQKGLINPVKQRTGITRSVKVAEKKRKTKSVPVPKKGPICPHCHKLLNTSPKIDLRSGPYYRAAYAALIAHGPVTAEKIDLVINTMELLLKQQLAKK